MKYFIYFLAILVLLGINIGLFNNLLVGGQMPNLLLLLALIFALDKNNLDFFFIAFAGGLLLDFYSTSFFGSYILAFLLASWFIHLLVENFMALEINWKSLTLMLFVFLASANLTVWLFGLTAFKFNWTQDYISFRLYLAGFPVSFFYNLVLLFPFYLFANWLKVFVDKLILRRRGVVR